MQKKNAKNVKISKSQNLKFSKSQNLKTYEHVFKICIGFGWEDGESPSMVFKFVSKFCQLFVSLSIDLSVILSVCRFWHSDLSARLSVCFFSHSGLSALLSVCQHFLLFFIIGFGDTNKKINKDDNDSSIENTNDCNNDINVDNIKDHHCNNNKAQALAFYAELLFF